jgi:hypothetical protein
MDFQQIIAYIILGIAIFYLLKKFVFKTKKGNDCGTDCGC